MNHDAARQKKDGTWGYTTSNNEYAYAIGYCKPFSEWSENSINSVFGNKEAYEAYIAPYRAVADKFHDGGHSTSSEACDCYKQYLLDFDLMFREDQEQPDTLHRCEAKDCNEFTSGEGRIKGSIRAWCLCSSHRDRETVGELLSVGESWHS